jgi:two-component system sensor histidine kinase YesM
LETAGISSSSELVRNRATIQRYYFYWTMICIVLAIFISVVISHHLSHPILRLRSSMQAVERGDFDISVDVTSNNEIGELARDFNIMIARIKELVQRNAEEQEAKRKSELTVLQNQITPHFLYNTLDSVIWMAESKQYTDVVKMVSSLARLLRLSISRGAEFVSIRDEIEHIESYLTIQKLRYRDKLDFSIAVHEVIMPLRVPKVILQPLVENAIYHGIKNKEQGGTVVIEGDIVDDYVLLSVRDDGVGMSPEHRETVLSGGSPSRTSHSHRTGYGSARVGVLNVHERIRLYFGTEYGLSFRENDGGGTVVDVHLPIVHEKDVRREGERE